MTKLMYLLYLVFPITFNTSNLHALRIKALKLLWTTICTNWACSYWLHKLYFCDQHL